MRNITLIIESDTSGTTWHFEGGTKNGRCPEAPFYAGFRDLQAIIQIPPSIAFLSRHCMVTWENPRDLVRTRMRTKRRQDAGARSFPEFFRFLPSFEPPAAHFFIAILQNRIFTENPREAA